MEKSLKADSDAGNIVHILPCQDPTSKCKIEQAESIILCMNQKLFAIFDQLEQRKVRII